MKRLALKDVRSRGAMLAVLVVVLLGCLPVAVWLDLRDLSESALRRQATNLNSVISSIRAYYASNIVGRVEYDYVSLNSRSYGGFGTAAPNASIVKAGIGFKF